MDTLPKDKWTSKIWNAKILTMLGALYLTLGAICFYFIEKDHETQLAADLEKRLEKIK